MLAVNNASSSLKSFWMSIDLASEKFDSGQPFLGREVEPIIEVFVDLRGIL